METNKWKTKEEIKTNLKKTIKSKNNICFTAGGLDAVKNFLL